MCSLTIPSTNRAIGIPCEKDVMMQPPHDLLTDEVDNTHDMTARLREAARARQLPSHPHDSHGGTAWHRCPSIGAVRRLRVPHEARRRHWLFHETTKALARCSSQKRLVPLWLSRLVQPVDSVEVHGMHLVFIVCRAVPNFPP